jgi:DNA topoisomerase-2
LFKLKISNFFKDDYTNFAAYDVFRKISNCVDGFKNTSRKVAYTMTKKYGGNDKIKVAQLAAAVSEFTQYLHGENSICGVTVNMAQDFVGTNNINLLMPEGSFGSRLIPASAAPRYIYTRKSELFDKIFKKEDEAILKKQVFEGSQIEFMSFCPIIPMLLVNGDRALSVGFSQSILPRNPLEIVKILKNYIKTKELPTKIVPWFRGFTGQVFKNDDGQVTCIGKVEKIHTTKVRITELPIGYDLESYVAVLNKLEEKGIIKYFQDLSESNNFEFEVNFKREILADKTEDELLDMLKLISRTTENFTCLDEKNKIKEYKSEIEILQHFINVRVKLYASRKQHQLKELLIEINKLKNKYKYISLVVNETIPVFKQKKETIIAKLQELGFEKIDGSYEYLLSVRVSAFTEDEMISLKTTINEKIATYNDLNSKSIGDIWLSELNDLESAMKKIYK